jgi:hypothetical protein
VSILNFGQISVTPITLRTSASLEDMRAAAIGQKPWPAAVGAGWGSVYDDPGPVNSPATVVIDAGNAIIVEEDAFTPEHLRVRAYWREADKKARDLLQQTSGPEVLRIAAADILISESVDDNEYQCLVSLRNPGVIKRHVQPALEDLLREDDDEATVNVDESPLALTDSDFFRWLLYRGHEDRELTDHIKVTDVRGIAGKDGRKRPTNLTRGADSDRPELVALIMAAHVNFGPIKIAIRDTELGLDAVFELRDDGGFNVLRNESLYFPDDVHHDEKGLKLVTDLAFKVVPEMRGAWRADKEWVTTNREASIDNAIKVMEQSIERLKRDRAAAHAAAQKAKREDS